MIQQTITTAPELFKQATSSNSHLMDFVASSFDFEKMEADTLILDRLLLLEECQKLLNQRESEIQLLRQDSPEFAFLLEELAEDKAMLSAEKKRFYAEDWVSFGD